MKRIVWKDVLAEAEGRGQSMFEYIADNTCSPGIVVVDENGEKVTQQRWADALGMSRQALGRYIRRSDGVTTGPPTKKHSPRSAFRSAPTEVKAELVREAISMYPEVAEAAFKAAAPRVSQADRKAAEAHTRRLTEPIRKAVGDVQVEFVWAERLNEVATEIAHHTETPSARALEVLTAAMARLNEEVQVLTSRLELEEVDR